MESDRTQNFHERLNQWVASQGFWFQLRYSMSAKGGRGTGLYHFLRLSARLVVFLLVAGAVWMAYLIKRSDTDGFREKLQGSIIAEAGAKEGKMEGFQRIGGKLSIARLAAAGKEGTFFTDVDVRDLGCRMGIFDGVFGVWRPGVITASKMDINLRAGTREKDAADTLGEVLFKTRQGLDINAFEVEEATVSWGYSEFNRGLIKGSRLKARKRDESWLFQFKGGTFSQNWLKGLEIVDLEVSCGPGGVRFEKGLLKSGNGTLDLAGLTVRGKERPELQGMAKLKNLSLEGLLPGAVGEFVEGVVSGELKVSGSTNSQEGIAFDGEVKLADGDGLMIRDRLPLFKSLRGVDMFNNYRRVNFETGSFRIKTGGGVLTVSDVDLSAGDLMGLKGGMKVRRPTREERGLVGGMAEMPALDGQGEPVVDAIDFTLKRAAAESRKKNPEGESGLMARYDVRVGEREFADRIAAAIAESLRYEGEFELSLRPEVFDQAPKLKDAFPEDEATGRILLKVPLEGTLGELTQRLASEISAKGKH